MKILFINANTNFGELLCEKLIYEGHEVVWCSYGKGICKAKEINYIDEWDKNPKSLGAIILSDIVIYQPLSVSNYNNIETYKREQNACNWLLKGVSNSNVKKIIYLSHSNSYINSDNLYLQSLAEIQQKLLNSKVGICTFKTNLISNSKAHPTEDEKLFLTQENKAIIGNPKNIVFVIGSYCYIKLITKAIINDKVGNYDVFSDVMELETFVKLINNFPDIKPKFFSYLHSKARALLQLDTNVNVVDLFHRPNTLMHNYFVQKDFEIQFETIFKNIQVNNTFTEVYNSKVKVSRVLGFN